MGGGGSLEMPAMEREKGMASLAVPFSSVSEAVVFVLKDHGEAWWWKHMFDEEEMKKMLLQGLVLSGQVLESTFYDQVTGVAKPGYSVKLTVLDAETDEKY